jgi:hypothetical protein
MAMATDASRAAGAGDLVLAFHPGHSGLFVPGIQCFGFPSQKLNAKGQNCKGLSGGSMKQAFCYLIFASKMELLPAAALVGNGFRKENRRILAKFAH